MSDPTKIFNPLGGYAVRRASNGDMMIGRIVLQIAGDLIVQPFLADGMFGTGATWPAAEIKFIGPMAECRARATRAYQLLLNERQRAVLLRQEAAEIEELACETADDILRGKFASQEEAPHE